MKELLFLLLEQLIEQLKELLFLFLLDNSFFFWSKVSLIYLLRYKIENLCNINYVIYDHLFTLSNCLLGHLLDWLENIDD